MLVVRWTYSINVEGLSAGWGLIGENDKVFQFKKSKYSFSLHTNLVFPILFIQRRIQNLFKHLRLNKNSLTDSASDTYEKCL